MSDFWNHKVRGCEPHGTIRAECNPRGHVSMTNRPVKVGDGLITGRKLRIRCVVKTENGKERTAFKELCKQLGIDAFQVERIGTTNLFDCCGTEESLVELTSIPSVVSWEFAVAPGGKRTNKDGKRAQRETVRKCINGRTVDVVVISRK